MSNRQVVVSSLWVQMLAGYSANPGSLEVLIRRNMVGSNNDDADLRLLGFHYHRLVAPYLHLGRQVILQVEGDPLAWTLGFIQGSIG